jgi:HEAT repeat protein/cyclophilin family peptidyl-prolyl cis-trans isomerase
MQRILPPSPRLECARAERSVGLMPSSRALLAALFAVCSIVVACDCGSPYNSRPADDDDGSLQVPEAEYMAILTAEHARDGSDGTLGAFLASDRPAVRAMAVRALGRIGAIVPLEETMVTKALSLLTDDEPRVRTAAAEAMPLISEGDSSLKSRLRSAVTDAIIDEADVDTKSALLEALGGFQESEDFAIFADVLRSPRTEDARVHEAACRGAYLALTASVSPRPQVDDALINGLLDWIMESDAPATEQPAQLLYQMAVTFLSTPLSREPFLERIQQGAQSAPYPMARSWLMWSLPTRTASELAVFSGLADDADPRMTLAWLVASYYMTNLTDPLAAKWIALLDHEHRGVRISAARRIADASDAPNSAAVLLPHFDTLAAKLQALDGSAEPVAKASLLDALSKIDPERGDALVRAHLDAESEAVRATAVGALGRAPFQPTDQDELAAVLDGDSPLMIERAMIALQRIDEADVSPTLTTALLNALRRGDFQAMAGLATEGNSGKITSDVTNAAVEGLELMGPEASALAKRVVLIFIRFTNATSHQALVEELVEDPSPVVANDARVTYEVLTGTELVAPTEPRVVPVTAALPTYAQIQSAVGSTVRLHFAAGDIDLQMSSEAPMTVTAFVERVRAGDYANTVMNYEYAPWMSGFGEQSGCVVQPTWGTSLRDERTAPNRFVPGVVTTSWADPDEGGAALAVMQNARFYNHAALAKQTVIGTTVSGFDVWSLLSVYDELLSAEVLP